MKCPNCGNDILPGEKFCTICGTKVPEETGINTPNNVNNDTLNTSNNNVESTVAPETTGVNPEPAQPVVQPEPTVVNTEPTQSVVEPETTGTYTAPVQPVGTPENTGTYNEPLQGQNNQYNAGNTNQANNMYQGNTNNSYNQNQQVPPVQPNQYNQGYNGYNQNNYGAINAPFDPKKFLVAFIGIAITIASDIFLPFATISATYSSYSSYYSNNRSLDIPNGTLSVLLIIGLMVTAIVLIVMQKERLALIPAFVSLAIVAFDCLNSANYNSVLERYTTSTSSASVSIGIGAIGMFIGLIVLIVGILTYKPNN